MDIVSFAAPTNEPIYKLYIKNNVQAGIIKSFVKFGFLSHKEIVTKTDAIIGSASIGTSKLKMPSVKLRHKKTAGQSGVFAHLCFSLFIKTISLNIPTKFGTIPA